MQRFPKNFLFGVATSAYQIEGGNRHSDWWYFEKKGKIKARSGLACDHRRKYKQDLELLKKLNIQAYRFSVEWSRLQPKKDKWDKKEIEYYRNILKILKTQGVEPFLTLHHFTNPLWFYRLGGWEKEENIKYFSNFVKRIVKEFKPYVRYWITINEPMALCFHSYIEKRFPPFKNDPLLYFTCLKNLLLAHREAYSVIHQKIKNAQVGLAQNVQYFWPYNTESPRDKLAAYLHNFYRNEIVTKVLYEGKFMFPLGGGEKIKDLKCDFIGFNYYSRTAIKFNSDSFGLGKKIVNPKAKELTQMGWEIYPFGLYKFLLRFGKYKKPIYILENGIATLDDSQRQRFILAHLKQVLKAIKAGIKVKGYFYWSLLDNFEWDYGFRPRFGLIEVNYKNQERKIRKSGLIYAKIANRKAI